MKTEAKDDWIEVLINFLTQYIQNILVLVIKTNVNNPMTCYILQLLVIKATTTTGRVPCEQVDVST